MTHKEHGNRFSDRACRCDSKSGLNTAEELLQVSDLVLKAVLGSTKGVNANKSGYEAAGQGCRIHASQCFGGCKMPRCWKRAIAYHKMQLKGANQLILLRMQGDDRLNHLLVGLKPRLQAAGKEEGVRGSGTVSERAR